MAITSVVQQPVSASVQDLATERLRVLVVDYSVGFGGATKGMALMLRGMPEVEPVIVTSQEPDVAELWYGEWPVYPFRRRINYRSRWVVQEWAEALPLQAISQRVSSKLFALADAGVTFASAFQLVRLIRQHRIDVLHLANGFGPPDAMLAGRISGVPTIAHLRGFYTPRRSTRTKPSAFAPSLVLGASEAVIEGYRQGASHPVRSQSLYEAVEIDKFEAAALRKDELRRSLNISEDQIAVGIFGRVIGWKGQLEYVAGMIPAMERNDRLVGVIVGDASDGTESYFEEVKRRIRESGYADRFRLTGYVEEVEPYYCAMDFVVHASIEPEPFGMVVTEAMAARRPVIAANAGGPLETVIDGVDGRLVDPQDAEALAAAIVEMASDRERCRAMGEAGFEKVRKHFDLPMVSARMKQIYQELVAEQNRSR